jgi:hypothetical protein
MDFPIGHNTTLGYVIGTIQTNYSNGKINLLSVLFIFILSLYQLKHAFHYQDGASVLCTLSALVIQLWSECIREMSGLMICMAWIYMVIPNAIRYNA